MYTQEQINIIAKCYMEEISRLTEIKANMSLTILSLRTKNAELLKEIAELKKPVENGQEVTIKN